MLHRKSFYFVITHHWTFKRSKSEVLDIDGRTFRSISPISMYTELMIACRVDVTTNVRRCRSNIIYFEHTANFLQ